jgi:paraquat-inducible protein B
MADSSESPGIPQATVVPARRARISIVWIIPILAAVVAVGIAVQRIMNEGPTITIVFKAAEGLEAGKTAIKYKDVSIGQVKKVELSPDHSKVVVTAKMAKSAADLMVEDAKFWVVEARVTLSGVSGLGTLLSGNYIGFEIGKSKKEERNFTGLEVAPIITGGQPGRQFLLKAENLGSLGIGSPIYYRRLQAGQVIAYDLAADGTSIDMKIFVNAPYDKYVNPGTRFWNASGIDVSVGAGGVEVRTQSLVALLAGGLTFETPSFAEAAGAAAADTAFTLYEDRATAMKQPDPISQRYVLYFNETLRGLSKGAPVTLLGLPAGEVLDVGLDLNPATGSIRGRVEVATFPERLIARLNQQQAGTGEALAKSQQQRRALMEQLVERRGLRAQLRSGNLLTGQLFVALDYFPDAPKAKIDWSGEVPVFPVVASTISDLEAKLSSIVAKLEKLPLEAIGADAAKALVTLDNTLAKLEKLPLEAIGADAAKALVTLNSTLESAGTALNRIDSDLTPALKTTMDELRGAVATANLLLKNTDATLLGKDAPAQQELRDALQEISAAARSVRVLADYLDRHPEALIRGKSEDKP